LAVIWSSDQHEMKHRTQQNRLLPGPMQNTIYKEPLSDKKKGVVTGQLL